MSTPALDLFTVKVMTLLNLLIVSGATVLAWRANRMVKGLRPFALGIVTMWAGGALLLARTYISGNGIIIVANVALFAGMVTVTQGIRVFRERPPHSPLALAVFTAPFAALYLYWMFVHDSFAMRVAVASPAFAILSLDASVSMLRGVSARERLIYWPAGFGFALSAVYLSARTWTALTGHYGAYLLAPVPMEIAGGFASNIAYVGCMFGMLLASNAAVRRESEKMALYDPLTSLPNRRLFLDRLLEAEQRARAGASCLAVIYLDLDGFKKVNDTLGHQAGDDLLKNVSLSMTRVLRAEDCLARMGGDEFVVLVENVANREDIAHLAERLKSAVEDGGTLRISWGIAVFPEEGSSAHDVMREADAAMYKAKRRARLPESQPEAPAQSLQTA